MIFDDIVARARTNIAKRRRYNRLVAEIENLSSRDLADLRADRSEMLFQVPSRSTAEFFGRLCGLGRRVEIQVRPS